MINISDIYDAFLSKVSDYSFLEPSLTQADIEDELFGYFRSARTKFYRCKQSLVTEVDISGDIFIKSVLTPYEIEVLITLMIVEYMKPQVLSSEVLKQSLSDKDFKIYSQANQLRELNLLYRMFRTEAVKMITEYSYMEMTDKW